MHDTVTTLFREGPSKEALEHANYSYKKEYSRLFLKHHIRVGWVKRKRTHQNKWCPFTGFWVLVFSCLRVGTQAYLRLPVRNRTQTGATHRQAQTGNNILASNHFKLTNKRKVNVEHVNGYHISNRKMQ